jgi:hypothetical protein
MSEEKERTNATRGPLVDAYKSLFSQTRETVIEQRGNWMLMRWPQCNGVIMLSIRWSSIDVQSVVVGGEEVLFAKADGARPVPRWCWEALAAAVALVPLDSGGQKVNPSDWLPPPA